jgi:hypothetical protein
MKKHMVMATRRSHSRTCNNLVEVAVGAVVMTAFAALFAAAILLPDPFYEKGGERVASPAHQPAPTLAQSEKEKQP